MDTRHSSRNRGNQMTVNFVNFELPESHFPKLIHSWWWRWFLDHLDSGIGYPGLALTGQRINFIDGCNGKLSSFQGHQTPHSIQIGEGKIELEGMFDFLNCYLPGLSVQPSLCWWICYHFITKEKMSPGWISHWIEVVVAWISSLLKIKRV